MAVHTTAESFNRALLAHSVRVKRNAETAFRDTIKAGANVCVALSPRDTGFFVSNWELVGDGDTPRVGRFGSYRELAAARRTGSGRAVELAARATDDVNEAAKAAKLGTRRDVANATLYGQYLEDGSSQQAPAGVLTPARQAALLEWSRKRLLGAA